jgi:exopolysaccharide biosynthesis WecB/TagA/CpsF family protein
MNKPEALGVNTWDLYDSVIGAFGGRFSVAAVGGDEDALVSARKDNRFNPVVLYVAPRTLKKGTEKLELQLPMYVGSVRVMLIAGHDGAYGATDATVPVQSPLMVVTTLPRVLGSSEKVLGLIRQRAAVDYPNLEIVTYSPPYKPEFSEEDNQAMIQAINDANPDLLWIGMTAPKQEKWAYRHWNELNIHCHCGTIGAVFDFYAGTSKRAPLWWQTHCLEWLHRLLSEPRRMWRRYLIGNPLFLWYILKEKLF